MTNVRYRYKISGISAEDHKWTVSDEVLAPAGSTLDVFKWAMADVLSKLTGQAGCNGPHWIRVVTIEVGDDEKLMTQINDMCNHLVACAELWRATNVARAQTITRTAEAIRALAKNVLPD